MLEIIIVVLELQWRELPKVSCFQLSYSKEIQFPIFYGVRIWLLSPLHWVLSFQFQEVLKRNIYVVLKIDYKWGNLSLRSCWSDFEKFLLGWDQPKEEILQELWKNTSLDIAAILFSSLHNYTSWSSCHFFASSPSTYSSGPLSMISASFTPM